MTHIASEHMVKWMADTVHRTYHQDKPGHFSECPMSLCRSATDHLRELQIERESSGNASPSDERDWERGGFARQGREPGRAGWEGEIDA